MAKKQRIGLHVSAAGGVEKAPARAKEVGAEVFQFFSRSPRGGAASVISEEQAVLFKQRCTAYGFESYIHTPYYINFASKKAALREAAPRIIREELERGSRLGVKYVMTHMGSSRDHSENDQAPIPNDQSRTPVPNSALKQAIEGLKKVFVNNPKFSTKLLLEISAGAGAVLGDSFEELAYLLKGLGRRDVGICLDTCHMFASGYDVRTREAVDETMRTFKKTLGLTKLKLVHANDSKAGFGEHKDRHEHIGHGQIGDAGFKTLLAHKDFQKTNFILETKHDRLITEDIANLKKWRKQK